jgi:nitrate reductase NapD
MTFSEVPAGLRDGEGMTPGPPARADHGRQGDARHYSGVLVVTESGAVDRCADAVDALEGVEVHLRHHETARLVAVLEGDSVAAHEQHLDRIRAVPQVLMASLVYHYVDENPEGESPVPTDGREEEGEA